MSALRMGTPTFICSQRLNLLSVPWEKGVSFCFARAEGLDHNPVPIDPRQVLLKQVKRAKKLGIEIKVGTELEFYLLDAETNLPRDKGIGMYSLDKAAEMEPILGPVRKYLMEMGIPIEQSNPEYASGQAEVNIEYDEALIAADRVVMFRSFVRQLAAQHGLKATFMAKPFYEQGGSGFHCHYSLWKKGKNIFAEKNGKFSEIGRQYIAGLQKRMSETAICGATTVNAFRRKVPDSFCPVNNSWGYDNRTTGLRVIEGSSNACRVEKRDAGADCNPYLLLATDIAAGLDGIEKQMKPTKPTLGNAYEKFNGEAIPTELHQAIELARESKWLKNVMGELMHELVCQQSERELQFFSEQVTEVERKRYLDSF